MLIICLYVDNLIYMGNDGVMLERFKKSYCFDEGYATYLYESTYTNLWYKYS